LDPIPLPVLDPGRIEFGFERTHCACPACTVNCRHIPGYLIPADLERIAAIHPLGTDLFAWAKTHLLASPGALVAQKGALFRIPTLVPARRGDGACVFLSPASACTIHPVAPFGCAFFDAHQSHAQAERRSIAGLNAILRAWNENHLYAQVWRMLSQAGLVAPAPEEARKAMRGFLQRPKT
jgi:hypothetical protein